MSILVGFLICYVPIENIIRKEVNSRWKITFIFWLIHGILVILLPLLLCSHLWKYSNRVVTICSTIAFLLGFLGNRTIILIKHSLLSHVAIVCKYVGYGFIFSSNVVLLFLVLQLSCSGAATDLNLMHP